MGEVTREQVLDRLRSVEDPELHKDLVTLDMVKDIGIDGSTVRVQVELTTPACPLKDRIKQDVERAVGSLAGVSSVEVGFSAQVRSSRPPAASLPGVKNIVAVGAGKGGVGKSMVSVLLAYGLQRTGATVGLLDADVYGPSIPKMTGLEGGKPVIFGILGP